MGKGQRNRGKRPPAAAKAPAWKRFAPTIAVVVVLVLMVVVAMTRSDEAPADAGATDSSIGLVTSVPASTLDSIGVSAASPDRYNALPPGEPAIESDGLPVFTYIGAEYCPFCAGERWPVVVALSRFGTFGGLSATVSGSSPEPYPETPTLTFHGATYASDYLVLSAVEYATNIPDGNGGFTRLDDLTAEQQRLLDTYDTQAYVGGDGGIPFVLVGNRYAWSGATVDLEKLSGLTFDEIAMRLSDQEDEVAQMIGSSANMITAMICQLTGDQPGDVCSSAGVTAAKALLPA